MCTVVLLLRPGHDWPVLLAANRDERVDRAWDLPAAHWPEQPGTVAGRDRLGGGTWMAMRGGVVAAVLNRPGSLGPEAGKLSRGRLPLLAVAENSGAAAAAAMGAVDGMAYRTFNMVVADRGGAWFIRLEHGAPDVRALPPGLHMMTAHDPNDPSSARVRTHLPRFAAAEVPNPGRGDWSAWLALLADRSGPREAAVNVAACDGFGTVCSSFAAIPASGPPVWLFAAGPPDRAPFLPVALQG